MNDEAQSSSSKKKRTARSPSYPSISLKKSLEQVRALYDQEGDYPAPLAEAVRSWGYSQKSSGGRQTLATLKYFGLIEVSGDKNNRKVKISDIGRRIILDERDDQTEKKQLIKRVALTPAPHLAIYEEYPDGLASDNTVTHFLVFEKNFQPDAAADLLSEYKETMMFADIYNKDTAGNGDDAIDEDTDDIDEESVEVGDVIQWTSKGVDQFSEKVTVLAFSDDGNWVFTDQSPSAIPLDEVTVLQKSNGEQQSPKEPPAPPPHVLQALKEKESGKERKGLSENESILTSGKLKNGSFEVRVKGEIGAKDIGKIIVLLNAQKTILADEDDESGFEISEK